MKSLYPSRFVRRSASACLLSTVLSIAVVTPSLAKSARGHGRGATRVRVAAAKLPTQAASPADAPFAISSTGLDSLRKRATLLPRRTGNTPPPPSQPPAHTNGFPIHNAAAFTWTGGGTDNNWSTGANWGGIAPGATANADLTFSGATRLAPTLDTTFSVNSLTFSATAGAFVIGGSALTLGAGGITTSSATNLATLSNAQVILSASQTWNVGAGGLLVNGPIVGAYGLTKTGAGTLTLNASSQYTGGTTVLAGILDVTNDRGLGAIPTNTAVANLTLNGGTFQWGNTFNLVAGRTIALGASGGTFDTQSYSVVIPGAIIGTGGFTKIGAGALSLTGNNTFSGGITIGAGTLTLKNDAALGTAPSSPTTVVTIGAGTFQLGGSFTLNANRNVALTGANAILDTNGFALTIPGVVSGTTLTKVGPGTLTLTGVNTYTGGTVINAGVLNAASESALGTAPAVAATNLTLNGGTLQWGSAFNPSAKRLISLGASGGTFDNNGFGNIVASVISGSGALISVGTGTLTLTGVNTYTGATTVTSGIVNILGDTSLGASGSTLALTLNAATLQFGGAASLSNKRNLTLAPLSSVGSTIDVQSYNDAIAGIIGGTGGLTIKGTGTLTLSGTNTYTGGTVVLAPLLNINADAALGATSGALTMSNNTLQFVNSFTMSRTLTLNGTSVTFDVQSYSTTISGVISGGASLIETGTGLLYLTGVNTYTGGTVINGALKASTDGALGATTGSSSGSLTFNNGTFTFGASFSPSSIRPITLNGTTDTFNTNGNSGTLGSVISGGGGLAKTGTGTLTLTGVNTYTGGTSVAGGVLAYSTGANVGIPSGSAAVVVGAAGTAADTAAVTSNADSVAFLATVDHSSTGVIAFNGTVSTGVTFDFSAFTGASLGAVTNQTFAATNLLTPSGTTYRLGGGGGTLTFQSLLSGGNSLVVGNTSTGGTVILSAANTYTGGTTVAGGTLSIASAANVGGAAGSVTVNSGAVLASSASLTTQTTTNAFLGLVAPSSAGVVALGSTTNTANLDFSSLTNATLGAIGTDTYSTGTLTPNNATYRLGGGGGTLNFNALLSGGNSLLVYGNGTTGGTVVLGNAANTYTGTTTINSGTLQISADGNLGAPTGYSASNITLGNATLYFFNTFTWNPYRGITLTGTGSTLNINAGLTQIVSQPIAGTGSLTKTGTGTLELSPATGVANTFTGTTTISAGTLQYDSQAAMAGTASSIVVSSGANAILNFLPDGSAMPLFSNSNSSSGVIALGAANATMPLTQALTFAGAGSASLGAAAALTYNGNLTPNGTTYRLYAGTTTAGYTFTVGSLLVSTNALTINSYTTTTPGTIVLTGANTYSGATTITNGTLQAGPGNTSAFGTNSAVTLSNATSTLDLNGNAESVGSLSGSNTSSAVKLGSGGALTLAATSNTTSFSGVIGGTGSLLKTGGSTQNLSGANTFTGSVGVSAGTLNFANAGALNTGISSIGLSSPGVVETGFAPTQNVLNTIASGGAATGTLSLGVSSSNALDFSAPNLAGLTLGATVASTFSGTLMPNSGVYRLGGGGSTLTVSTALTGANNLTVDSNGSAVGTVVLSGVNTYVGATTLNVGTLQAAANNTSAFGTNSAVTLSSIVATTLDLNNNNETLGALGGGIASSTVKLGTGTLTVGALGTTTTYAGAITGTGSIDKVGAGLLDLSGANTYSGATTIDGGTLQFDHSNSLGGATGTTLVNFGSTAAAGYALDQLALYKFTTGSAGVVAFAAASTNSLDLSANGASLASVSLGAVGNVVFSGTLNPYGSAYRLGGGGGTLTVSKALADGSSGATSMIVDVNGTALGTVILGGVNTTNTYSGGTTINAGTLQIANDTNLGAIPASANAGNVVFAGGILQAGANVALAPTRGLQINSVGGTIDTQANTVAVPGVVAGSGALTKIGAGTLALSGANTYTGATIVNAGTLQISADANLGAAPASATPAALVVTNATLQFAGAATLNANRGLQFSGASGDTIDTQGNAVTINGGVSGSAGLIKIGAGTLTLAGTNTYTGTITVGAGTLIAPNGAGAISVAGGTTLAAAGSVNAVSLAAASILAPQSTSGAAIGTLNATSLTVADNSVFNFDLGANRASDSLNLSGAFGYNPSSSGTISFAFDMPVLGTAKPGDVFTLVTFATNPTGASTANSSKFVATPRGNLGGIQGVFALTPAAGVQAGTLTYTLSGSDALPEPAALPLLVLGLGSMGEIARRRRRVRGTTA